MTDLILIRCSADSHPGRVSKIDTALKFEGGWGLNDGSYIHRRDQTSRSALFGDDLSYTSNDADDRFEEHVTRPAGSSPGAQRSPKMRRTRKLRCRLCRLDVTIQEDRLFRFLDELAAAGIDEVELQHLQRYGC